VKKQVSCDVCRCERAKEEVELLEMEKRTAASGMLGGTKSRACGSYASILAGIRALAQHQRNATLPALLVREGVSIADGYETDACQDEICMPVRADKRISMGAGMKGGVYTPASGARTG
jgi:hypothetical protein